MLTSGIRMLVDGKYHELLRVAQKCFFVLHKTMEIRRASHNFAPGRFKFNCQVLVTYMIRLP